MVSKADIATMEALSNQAENILIGAESSQSEPPSTNKVGASGGALGLYQDPVINAFSPVRSVASCTCGYGYFSFPNN